MSSPAFADRAALDKHTIEEGTQLAPKFDADGLMPAVVTHHQTNEPLMLAYMNAEALQRTLQSGEAHFYSRSRGKMWKKGESSGNVLKVHDVLVDCEQDTLWVKAEIAGGGAACHVGYRSCFYRRIPMEQAADGQTPAAVAFTEHEKMFDPDEVYGKQG